MKSATANLTAQPGSVSHGTHRPEDLIPAFLSALEALDPSRARRLRWRERLLLNWLDDDWRANRTKAELDERRAYFREQAYLFLGELFNTLDEYSPAGHYFGYRPGDGSDYGWWPCDDC